MDLPLVRYLLASLMWALRKQPQRQPGLELTTFAHYRMACLAEQEEAPKQTMAI